ncbi:PH protein [Venustampulla echinocandica]|uniref:PH protein n=1 Tax=Venustampulla echinocandica TaxID=2656787 RepID=A0A370TV92_9HELO|nr:PH protein [Venustampulla echinocandica]RDL39462.1 PH protein [Venustampulla echinocandica]
MYQFHQEQLSYSLLAAQEKKLKARKSWVMTSPGSESFIKLPNEEILFSSPQRTSLQLSTPNTYPGSQPYSAKSDGGIVYITNQRIVYLPTTPTAELQSFSSPILNLQDTFVRAPFFGANYWTANVKPVSGGGIPPTNSAIELRLTFREGGAFDFHNTYEQIKERLYQAYMVARESGRAGDSNMDFGNVHLEQLPAYEACSTVEDGDELEAPPYESPREVENQEDEPRILSPVPIRPTRDTTIGVEKSSSNS